MKNADLSPDRKTDRATQADENARRRRSWNVLYPLVHAYCAMRYGLTFDPVPIEGPYLFVSNHASNVVDILFTAMAAGKMGMVYVGSEHVMRSGLAGRLLRKNLGYISRPKGAAAISTVREILKTLRSGMSVCLFAEGSASWDGRNIPIVKGTGSLVKACGVPLVTYRLEGSYLIRPRWSRKVRKGKAHGSLVGVYPPDMLKAMAPQEINGLIDRDIREDVWERQRQAMVHLHGRHQAEYLERLLYLCPHCRAVSSLTSRGDQLVCSCGRSWTYTDTGFLQPAEPFETLAQWEDWQKEQMQSGGFKAAAPEDLLFSDQECELSEINKESGAHLLGEGTLAQRKGSLSCAGFDFSLADIREMDMVRHNLLLFTAKDGYYQIKANGKRTNLRKYTEVWHALQAPGSTVQK